VLWAVAAAVIRPGVTLLPSHWLDGRGYSGDPGGPTATESGRRLLRTFPDVSPPPSAGEGRGKARCLALHALPNGRRTHHDCWASSACPTPRATATGRSGSASRSRAMPPGGARRTGRAVPAAVSRLRHVGQRRRCRRRRHNASGGLTRPPLTDCSTGPRRIRERQGPMPDPTTKGSTPDPGVVPTHTLIGPLR
jgi:hypothetical protein